MENTNDTHNVKRSFSLWVGEMREFLRGRFSLDEDKAQRDEVVAAISKGVVFRGVNLWVLIFATMIASLGLNVNSAAVIIGAMLISPIMGPIMGIGLSLGINDFELLKKSLRNYALMFGVAIVTSPLAVEGKIRYEQAFRGLEELRQNVDSLLIINNENILEIYGRLALKQAFGKADDILASAAKGIAEIITVESDLVNVDFADVSKVMRDSGRAHMSVATAEGDNRAEAVAEASLHSPLLDHNLISGARNILLNISVANAEELMYEEVVRILEYIQAHASVEDESGNIHNANIIWGTSEKPQLGNAIELVVVATGFEGDEEKRMMETVIPPARIVKPVPEGADPAGKPVLEPVGKPGKATPQTRPLEQVILGEKSTRYSNIDQILAKPAYQSRKAQFIVEMPAGRKEVLKEEKGAAERAEENRSESLFD